MSPTLNGPYRSIQWAPKFAEDLVESSLGGEVYAYREMVGRVLLLRGFFEPFAGSSPGMIVFEYCGSLLATMKHKEPIAEKYLGRGFLDSTVVGEQ